jgi:hypothetical protein
VEAEGAVSETLGLFKSHLCLFLKVCRPSSERWYNGISVVVYPLIRFRSGSSIGRWLVPALSLLFPLSNLWSPVASCPVSNMVHHGPVLAVEGSCIASGSAYSHSVGCQLLGQTPPVRKSGNPKQQERQETRPLPPGNPRESRAQLCCHAPPPLSITAAKSLLAMWPGSYHAVHACRRIAGLAFASRDRVPSP